MSISIVMVVYATAMLRSLARLPDQTNCFNDLQILVSELVSKNIYISILLVNIALIVQALLSLKVYRTLCQISKKLFNFSLRYRRPKYPHPKFSGTIRTGTYFCLKIRYKIMCSISWLCESNTFSESDGVRIIQE